MARKRKTARPPSREGQLRYQVQLMLAAPVITPMMISDLLILGARIYSQGIGLPQHTVWNSILEGFADHGRYYLSPDQQAALQGSDQAVFDHLSE
jgi:hypothetical protein